MRSGWGSMGGVWVGQWDFALVYTRPSRSFHGALFFTTNHTTTTVPPAGLQLACSGMGGVVGMWCFQIELMPVCSKQSVCAVTCCQYVTCCCCQ